jgi:hypothetical protein
LRQRHARCLRQRHARCLRQRLARCLRQRQLSDAPTACRLVLPAWSSLDDGGRLLRAAMHREAGRSGARAGATAAAPAAGEHKGEHKGAAAGDAGLVVVRAGELLHPLAAKQSFVYVARTAAGWFYVGETDDLPTRIAAHRKSPTLGATCVCFVCMAVPAGGKSMARRVEAALLRDLWHSGFPLLSLADAAHLRFGASSS